MLDSIGSGQNPIGNYYRASSNGSQPPSPLQDGSQSALQNASSEGTAAIRATNPLREDQGQALSAEQSSRPTLDSGGGRGSQLDITA